MSDEPVVVPSPRCRLCGNKATRLAKAHIFPRGFFQNLPEKARVNSMGINGETGRRLQNAIYDQSIICDNCEHGIMAPLDDYAIQIIRDKKDGIYIKLPSGSKSRIIVFDNVDKNKIRAFFASVLWRCSLSQQFELKGVSIGNEYEKRIQDDLLHWSEPNRFLYCDVFLCKGIYTSLCARAGKFSMTTCLKSAIFVRS